MNGPTPPAPEHGAPNSGASSPGHRPMRYALLSDVHGRRTKLEAVLDDIQSRGAGRIVSLGDVGGDDCLELLCRAGAVGVFGNYEVSGWRRLRPPHRAWVRSWPPLLAEDRFLAAHAVPWRPEGVNSVAEYGHWLRETGQSWGALFPYLNKDEDFMWQALADLESAGRTILFHGHTHQQAIWRWEPAGRLSQVRAPVVPVETGHNYVVGVGSVGLPQDGSWAAYTIYDASAGQIEQVRVGPGLPLL